MLVKTKVLIPVIALLTALITVVPLPVTQNQANANATVKTKQSEKVAVKKLPTVVKIPYKYATPNYNKAYAKKTMSSNYGWGSRQYKCLVTLWNRESGWRVNAHNSSGAHGIPQALPGHKMSSAGPNWKSNPHTQIKWGLRYIKGRYGTPCSALGHSYNHGWY